MKALKNLNFESKCSNFLKGREDPKIFINKTYISKIYLIGEIF